MALVILCITIYRLCYMYMYIVWAFSVILFVDIGERLSSIHHYFLHIWDCLFRTKYADINSVHI